MRTVARLLIGVVLLGGTLAVGIAIGIIVEHRARHHQQQLFDSKTTIRC